MKRFGAMIISGLFFAAACAAQSKVPAKGASKSAALTMTAANSAPAITAPALAMIDGQPITEDDVLPPDRWPTTMSDVVSDILRRLPEKDKQLVKTTKKEDLIRFHHGWGTGIRNYYGLWRGNSKLIASACGKPCHPDDASMVIIETVWATLQK